MKRILSIMTSLAVAVLIMTLSVGFVYAAGLMKPINSSLPDLQIEQHKVNVTINNGFAITEVDQVFYNPHDQTLDALYTFPLPKQAALSELSLWINEQEVVGEVVEKEEGRKIAQQEKSEGRETALAEQREYYAFDVHVTPVNARSKVRVRLLYMQPIEIDGGVGRYVYPLEEGKIDEEMHTFWNRQTKVHGTFQFECSIHSAYPLDEVRVKGSSKAVVTQEVSGIWNAQIHEEEGSASLEKDIVVYYRLAPNQPARVDLFPYRNGTGPGTYMMVITPGADLKPIQEGVDWTLVLDVSGSMTDKIAAATDGLAKALDHLRLHDRFRIITFSDTAREITSGWTVSNPENVKHYQDRIKLLHAQEGTNLYAGFEAGIKSLDADRTSAIVLVSDGGANVGPTEYNAFRKLLDKKDVRVFTFVIGEGANRPLLGRLADESGGLSMDVSNQDDLYGRILQAKTKLAHEAMHGLKIEWDGATVTDIAPEQLPNLYVGQQIVVFGRYMQPGPAKMQLHAKISGEDKTWETRLLLPDQDTTFPEIERLWALARIREIEKKIEDGSDASELKQAIVHLGTQYSIVSNYTSMVVVRDDRFDLLGIQRRNKARVAIERAAQGERGKQYLIPTRVDSAQPLFGHTSSYDISRSGGSDSSSSSGSGAIGPVSVALLMGLYGISRMAQDRRKQ